MCGIAGYLGNAQPEILEKMAAGMPNRGPDDKTFFRSGALGLAHLRLTIIDEDKGKQPMASADDRYTLIYNGEVYNYKALRQELEQEAGTVFTTESDTEVVLQALVHWGEAALDRFDGMFAVALWDEQEQELFVARDQFGIKPLYYTRNNPSQTFYFASEIPPLLETIEQVEPNDRVIYRYLNFRIHDDGAETFFDQIYRLEPGHAMKLRWNPDAKTPVVDQPYRYTSLNEGLEKLAQDPGQPYTDEVIAEFKDLLTESIELRLQSDRKVGTSLSGGLDSSVVAGVIADHLSQLRPEERPEQLGTKQKTFSAIFPNERNDEEPYVDAVLDLHGDVIDPVKIIPRSNEFLDDVKDYVATQAEPVISTGPYAQYVVMREASKHVTVLLDGQGADEMMAGYNPYFLVYLRQLKKEGRWKDLFREAWHCRDILFKLLGDKLSTVFAKKRGIRELLNQDFVSAYSSERYVSTQDHLKTRLMEDIFSNSLQSLLRYEDRSTSRFSLEGRVPFITTKIVEHIFKIGDDAIINDGWNKRILREAMEGVLPEMISRRRKKIGFTTPEQDWFLEIKGPIYELFASESFGKRKYFKQHDVLEAFRDFMEGEGQLNSMDFWRMLNVELWLREFVDVEDAWTEKPLPPWIPGQVNPEKNLTIQVEDSAWDRYPIRTEKVNADTDLAKMIIDLLPPYLQHPEISQKLENESWGLAISEKIVAISQGRSYLIYEMSPSWWAKFLSRYVNRTPAGIGLGSPYTMELAIQEVGLPRILLASVAAALGRIVGKKGVFYNIAGGDVRAIDGPTEYSVCPSNVSAKLPPKDPSRVAAQLSTAVRQSGLLTKAQLEHFTGFLVMDANDLGCNLLGSDAPLPAETYEALFKDNPKGQGGQQTPLLIFVERSDVDSAKS